MSKNQRRMIHKVISVTHQCLMTGETYEPMRASVPGTTAIKDGSREQQLIADYRERGLSFTETTMLVNRWCHRNGHESVTRSAVRTCKMKMVKQITTIQKRPQGTNDKDSTWARARYRASLESHLHTDLRTLLNESRGVSAFFEASDDSSEGEEEGDGGESE